MDRCGRRHKEGTISMNTKPSYEQLVEEARLAKTLMVRVEEADGIAVVTMSDPSNRNALGAALTLQLRDTLERLAADAAVRAIVLTGDGGAFSAGGDLRAMVEKVEPIVDESDEGAVAMWRWIRRHFGSIVRTIVGTDKPFIAAVGGPAAGVGLAFAMACASR